jgi:hypothetical protein
MASYTWPRDIKSKDKDSEVRLLGRKRRERRGGRGGLSGSSRIKGGRLT